MKQATDFIIDKNLRRLLCRNRKILQVRKIKESFQMICWIIYQEAGLTNRQMKNRKIYPAAQGWPAPIIHV